MPETAHGSEGARADAAVPVSSAQERAWLLQQLNPQSPLYQTRVSFRLRGQLDLDVLRRAFEAVIGRHEPLRTVFVAPHGRPLQVVLAPTRTHLPVLELAGAAAEQIQAALDNEFRAPADLEHGPLLRAAVLRLGPDDHVLGVSIHHCAADASSLPVFGNELLEHYGAFVEGRTPKVPDIPITYSEYVAGEREAAADQEFWRTTLADLPPMTELPVDRPRSALRDRRAALFERTLDASTADELRTLCGTEAATPFMVGLAVFAAVLARHCGHGDDLMIALPVSGRPRPEHENMIGCFQNMLVLRLAAVSRSSFRELVRQARRVTLDAVAHQSLPFQRMVQASGIGRGRDENPFTTVAFSVRAGDPEPESWRYGGVECLLIPVLTRIAAFDATLVLHLRSDGIACQWQYATEIFDPTTMSAFADRFERFLASALRFPNDLISDIALISPSEQHFLVHELNQTSGPVPRTTLDGLVRAQARRTPDVPAVTCGAVTLTYRDLDLRADRLAHLLHRNGVRQESRVAILLERSLELVVAMLAVTRAGGAYVPLEPGHPPARLRLMLEDSGAAVVLTTAALRPYLPAHQGTTLCIGKEEAAPKAESQEAPSVRSDPSSLAYVIYTSGTSGAPKGVAVAHRQAVNVIDWINATFAVGSGDRILFVTSACFDLSVYDVYGPLAAGAEVVVATDDEVRDPERLLTLLGTGGITIWDSAPAAMQQLMLTADATGYAAGGALRLVMLSGDWIPLTLPERVRSSFPRAQVVALGGATEATIWSNMFPVGAVDPGWVSIPYGRPTRNARYYVLDERLGPVPAGVAGDLYIGGDVLARGYYGRPGLTSERFLPDPFGAAPGGVMYATGDRARVCSANGTIEFLGRLDDQLKIRGFRVETAEVEAALEAHQDVAACAVVATGPREERSLTAYFVSNGRRPLPSDLREHLADRLPGHMIPGRFVAIRELPLTPNGKLDRRQLPRQEAMAEVTEQRALPSTPTEFAAAQVWESVLSRAGIGLDENFFEIGGHSLLALQVVLAARARFGKDLPGGILLANQTLREFASAIDSWPTIGQGTAALQRLRGRGTGPAVVLVHPVGGGVACYAELAARLPEHEIYAFETRRPPRGSLSDLAAEYVEELSRVMPTSRFLLGGWSLGARLVFEMALSLSETGEEPPLLLIDPLGTAPPVEERQVAEPEMVSAFIHDFSAISGGSTPAVSDPTVRDPRSALEAALEDMHRRGIAAGLDFDEFARRYEIFRGNSKALLDHETRLDIAAREGGPIYEAPVYLAESESWETSIDLFLSVCANLSAIRLSGGHFDALRGQNATLLSDIVKRALVEFAS